VPGAIGRVDCGAEAALMRLQVCASFDQQAGRIELPQCRSLDEGRPPGGRLRVDVGARRQQSAESV
jgi:hypothetical protein